LHPLGLPQGQLAASGSDAQKIFHQWPQLEQLEALQPLQEDDAEELTVLPPAPLETNPQADMSLHTLVLSQSGQAGVSWPNTRHSN